MYQPFIYRFLLEPQFRLCRYLLLILFFTIVSTNQALVGYLEVAPQLENNIYWIIIGTVLIYMATVIFLKKAVLRYLLAGKYLLFASYVISCAFLYIIISNVVYCLYVDDYSCFSESVMIDNISAFVIFILCILGIIIPVFLKNWVVVNQRLNGLKIKQVSSQVELFKEQINPPSFFKVLSKSKNSVKTDPDKASAMLMKLSHLIRYQLYDCNREQVLLTAEISFLRNFLELEKLYSSKFDYSLETEGNVNGIFVLPSVLLPYVQSVINAFDNEQDTHVIKIHLNNAENIIYITLEISGISKNLLQKEVLKVKERLNALCKGHYSLYVNDDGFTKMILELNK